MSLNRVRFHGHHLDESIQSNVANVVVPIREELSENVHTQHPEARIRFNVEDG
jgi:hypothetical protein